MGKVIVFILLALGAYYIYDHQDELLVGARELFLKEKTVVKVNNASAEKQRAIQDAEQKALEY